MENIHIEETFMERRDCKGMKNLTPACVVQDREYRTKSLQQRGGGTPQTN